MKRRDLVTVALQGKRRRPRTALIIQSDLFHDLQAVAILPITSTLLHAPLTRILVQPDSRNGLTRPSQVKIDKPQTPHRGKLGPVFGDLDDLAMIAVNRALALFLGLV